MKMILFIYLFKKFFLLFICAYNAWVTSPAHQKMILNELLFISHHSSLQVLKYLVTSYPIKVIL
jgi:hypothetical protein